MPMTLASAIALAEARSCLAALADTATEFDESVQFEHLLLALDAMHVDYPGLYPLEENRSQLLRRLEAAVDRMLDLGGDGLSLELLLYAAQSGGPGGSFAD